MAAATNDMLLSLEMGTHDCYYRLRHEVGPASSVVYVHVRDLDILDADRQTYGPDVIGALRRLVPVWTHGWTTLTVFRANGAVAAAQDEWAPHCLRAIPPPGLLPHLPRINFVDLETGHGFKKRVSLVRVHGQQQHRCILKICPFQYQLAYLAREVRAYARFAAQACPLVPALLAYVYERSDDQIVGFVCEELHGRCAGPDDYDACKAALECLHHSYGLLHGDVNRLNIVLPPDGPSFVDLEMATFAEDAPGLDFARLQRAEADGLRNALADEEGWGRPWPVPTMA